MRCPEVHQGLGRQMGKKMKSQKQRHCEIPELPLEFRRKGYGAELLLPPPQVPYLVTVRTRKVAKYSGIPEQPEEIFCTIL